MRKDEYLVGEIAEALGISADTVRYYNKMGIVAPLRREENNYRYFDLNAVSNLHSVTLLRSFGVPVEKIQGCFDPQNIETLIAGLEETSGDILREIERLRQQQAELLRFYDFLRQVGTQYNQVTVRRSPWWQVVYEEHHLDIARMVKSFNAVMDREKKLPSYAFILPKESFLRHVRSYTQYGLLVEDPGGDLSDSVRLIEPQQCAYCAYWGRQMDLQNAYDQILIWIQENGYSVTGDIVERFIISGPSNSLMELWVPIG